MEVPEQAPDLSAPYVVRENESLERPRPEMNPTPLINSPDPVLQQDYNGTLRAGGTETVNILSNWAGLAAAVEPPDDNIAVGPNHVVQLTNNSTSSYMRVWNKSGTVLVANKTIQSFSNIADYGDPEILYDQAADRWAYVVLYSGSAHKLEVGVSKTNDPTGAWYIYSFTTKGGFPDYPKLGVWGNSYFITTNSTDPTVFALDRATMLAGSGTGTAQKFALSKFPTINFQAASPITQTGATAPPTGEPAMVIRMANAAWSSTLADELQLFELNINWTTPAQSTITGPIVLDVASFNSSLCGQGDNDCIPQEGSTTKLDPLNDIVMDKVQYVNTGSYESVVASHVVNADGNGTAGVRWYELRRNSGTGAWSIYQQSTYLPTTEDRWMSSISINSSGTIAMGYNISSSTVYPGYNITGRNSCDALNTMSVPETSIIAGKAANSSVRYGDYNGMVTDPVDGSFWFTGEYNPTKSWGTNIVHFTFSACATAAPQTSGNEVSGITSPSLLQQSLSVVPNPASDQVKIVFSSESEGIANMQITDITGKTVIQQNSQMAADVNTSNIDVHSLASGYYLVKVADGKSAATQKLIIQR
jgi:hypothetical protein